MIGAIILCTCACLVLGYEEADEVFSLPGYGKVEDRTFAGYLDCNESTGSRLFYMLFQSRLGPLTDPNIPLFIWLNGGPGASSSLGNLLENGPYLLQPDLSLKRNVHSWNSLAHVIYIDQPVGTGFSHCDHRDGDGNLSGECYVKDYVALGEQMWNALMSLMGPKGKFPYLIRNPFYITGESFGGIYIPHIAKYIFNRNKEKCPSTHCINLRSVAIGNPGNFHWKQYKTQIEFYRSMGLVGEADALHAEQTLWPLVEQMMREGDTVKAFDGAEQMGTFLSEKAGEPFLYDIRKWGNVYDKVYAKAMESYLSSPEVNEALHTRGEKWRNGDGTAAPNPVAEALKPTFMDSMLPVLDVLLEGGVKVVVYDGVFDASSCNHLGVFASLKLLSSASGAKLLASRREIWKGEDHPFGFVQKGGNLIFIWVANSGHMVPTDQPEAAIDIVKSFILPPKMRNTLLPERISYSTAVA